MKSFDSPWVTDNIGQYGEGLEKLLALAHEKRSRAGQPVYIQGERSHTFTSSGGGKWKSASFARTAAKRYWPYRKTALSSVRAPRWIISPYFATAMALEASDIFLVG